MRKYIITIISLLLISIFQFANAQEYTEILDKINDQNKGFSYLKDISVKLAAGEENRFSFVLSKNTLYNVSIYQPSLKTFELKLLDDKKEKTVEPTTVNVKKDFENHQYLFKNTGVYSIHIKNTSKEEVFTVIVLSFVNRVSDTEVNRLLSTDVTQEKSKNEESNTPETEDIYFTVEKMPKFNGKRSDEFRKYIQENLRYPKEAIDQKIEGRVFVQFTVSEEGYIKDAKVVRGSNPALNQEALRIVYSSPKWEPGKQDGNSVDVILTFPIEFKLP